MIRLLALLVSVLSAVALVLGVSYALSGNPGVAVDCSGEIVGFGESSLPLWVLGSDCGAEVEVFDGDISVCKGDSPVRDSRGVVPCEGLQDFEGGNLRIEAKFYNESGVFAEDSGDFRY